VGPASGSVVARFAGSSDPVQFHCNVFCQDERMVASWTLQNGNGMDPEQFITANNNPYITIDGDPRPGVSNRTFRNKLTIHNFVEALSGTVLRCKYLSQVLSLYHLYIYSKCGNTELLADTNSTY